MRDSTSTRRKIKVTQIPPDEQQSHADFSYEEAYDIAICGNRDYDDFVCDKFKNVRELVESTDYDLISEDNDIEKLKENLNDFLYTFVDDDKAKRIKEVCQDYHKGCVNFSTAMIIILSVLDEESWACKEIRGSVQGEWQEVYYNTKTYTREMINDIEMDYFNLGTEWRIDEGDGCPWHFYSHKSSMEDIKKEIMDELDLDESEIEFKRFKQYVTIPEYEVF